MIVEYSLVENPNTVLILNKENPVLHYNNNNQEESDHVRFSRAGHRDFFRRLSYSGVTWSNNISLVRGQGQFC